MAKKENEKHYLVTVVAFYTVTAKDQENAEALALTEYRQEISDNVLTPSLEVEEI